MSANDYRMASPNKFFVAVDKTALTVWDVHASVPDRFPIDCRYFGHVLRNVDVLLGPRGLDFYVIWHLDSLPVRGRNVVVIMVGDERYQVPSYAGDVLAVFKTGAIKPFRPYAGEKPISSSNPSIKSARCETVFCASSGGSHRRSWISMSFRYRWDITNRSSCRFGRSRSAR